MMSLAAALIGWLWIGAAAAPARSIKDVGECGVVREPRADFPKRIVHKREGDSLAAAVEGQ